jgi:glucans biosynthesis protein C
MDDTVPKPTPPTRFFYLDNFRSYLTAIVIYHHTALSYGGIGSWPYRSRFHKPASSPTLIAFNAINQSYFMASFFFLSGAMSSSSLDRKGRKAFWKGKWLRLGVPVLVYVLLQGPILRWMNGEELKLENLLAYWKGLRGVQGPVWYCALLLVFDTWFPFVPGAALENLTHCFPLAVFVVDIATCFLVRLLYPVGSIFVPLNLQPAYLPQYIASYLLGAARSSASPPVLNKANKIILLLSSIISGISIPVLLHTYPNVYAVDSANGGTNLVALSYAIWNETTGYLLGTSILALFRTSRPLSRPWGSVGRYSYAAFLIHAVVVLGVQICSDGWNAGGILKTVVIGTAGVFGSWGVGWVLLRIPGVRTVLA